MDEEKNVLGMKVVYYYIAFDKMKWGLMGFQEVRLYYVLIILVPVNWVIEESFSVGKLDSN